MQRHYPCFRSECNLLHTLLFFSEVVYYPQLVCKIWSHRIMFDVIKIVYKSTFNNPVIGNGTFYSCVLSTIKNASLTLKSFLVVMQCFATTRISRLCTSWKLLYIKVTPDLHLTYSKNRGKLGLVLKMKNIACISILLTKHVKYTYLYLFQFVLYSIVAFKAN